jgi:hypothetical protein
MAFSDYRRLVDVLKKFEIVPSDQLGLFAGYPLR